MHIVARLFGAAVLASVAAACTSASTSVAAPSSDKCQTGATNQTSSFPHGGGSGSVKVDATRDCTWSISADAPWIAIAGERSGQGEAVVGYTVSENPLPSPRNGALLLDGQRLPLSQAAAPCVFTLNPSEAAIGATGGSVATALTTLTGCPWTAASNASWIGLTGDSSGNASATIRLNVAPNAGAARDGAISIAGRAFVIRQAGAADPPATPPPPSPVPPPPSPAPPPPAPAPPTEVEFEGTLLLLTGSCPSVSFWAAGRFVIANDRTDFKRGNCRDLSLGDRVKVRGTTTGGGPVYATKIEFRDDD
jgi:hypothetical protein